MKLIGHAFLTGRVDFNRELNPWAFQRIDAGMRQNQKDRILVDPSQAEVVLVSAPVNEGQNPDWMQQLQEIMQSADSIYLQYKSEVLRFRMAYHDAGKNRNFVTLGNQDEFDRYSQEHWQRIRYLYAQRRVGAFCFDINTMISHRSDRNEPTRRIELETRFDQQHESGQPQIAVDATGSGAPVEIIEWRSNVKEGEIGRYSPDDAHLEVSVRNVNRPFTILHENRTEFKSHSYTFNGEKMEQLLRRVIQRKLKDRQSEIADA
jgi:hypothetical protein